MTNLCLSGSAHDLLPVNTIGECAACVLLFSESERGGFDGSGFLSRLCERLCVNDVQTHYALNGWATFARGHLLRMHDHCAEEYHEQRPVVDFAQVPSKVPKSARKRAFLFDAFHEMQSRLTG